MKSENKAIDLAKLFFSICVVAIHAQLLGGVKYGYLLKCNIFRIAVPFFFICSGYYLAVRIFKKKYDPKLYFKKNIKLYLLWCIFYTILYNIFALESFNILNFMNDLRNVFYFKSTNIMWYLGVIVLFGALVIHFKDKKIIKYLFILSIILYLCGLYFVTYKYLFINTSLEIGITFLSQYYLQNRYFLFTFMFPLIGFLIGKYDITKKMKFNYTIIGLILSQLLLFYESYKYYDKTSIYLEYDFFLMTPLVATFLFILLNKINFKLPFSTKILRKYSKGIFYYHYMFIFLYLFLERKIENDWFNLCSTHSSLYFFTILISTIIFIMILNLMKKIINLLLYKNRLYS